MYIRNCGLYWRLGITPFESVTGNSKDQIKRVRCVNFCDNIVQKTETCTSEPVQNVDQNTVEPCISESTRVEHAQDNDQNSADPSISDNEASITFRESVRKLAKPVYFKDYVTMVMPPLIKNIDYLYQMGGFETSESFEEPIQSENSLKWYQAMKDKICALTENETF